MSFPADTFDKSKHNYLQKCFYIINLMKDKDYDMWENFHAQYCVTKADESYELYTMILEDYRKMLEPVKHIKKKAAAKPKTKAKSKKAA